MALSDNSCSTKKYPLPETTFAPGETVFACFRPQAKKVIEDGVLKKELLAEAALTGVEEVWKIVVEAVNSTRPGLLREVQTATSVLHPLLSIAIFSLKVMGFQECDAVNTPQLLPRGICTHRQRSCCSSLCPGMCVQLAKHTKD